MILAKVERPPNLVLIRGLPGAGKSTAAAGRFPEFWHFEPDHYACDARGRYAFDAQLWPYCQQMCLMAVDLALARGRPVVVADVFADLASLGPYRDLARIHGAALRVVTIEGHGGPGIHGVPGFVLEEMRARFVPDHEIQTALFGLPPRDVDEYNGG